MKTVNSISGGKTSAYIAANYPADYNVFSLVRTDDKNCMFPDPKLRQMVSDRIGKEFIGTLEMDQIIKVIFDLEQFIGTEINWVSGITYDEVADGRGGWLPNKLHRYCTTFLKLDPIFNWWHQTIGDPVEMRIGFRANEQRRAKTMNEKLNSNGLLEMKAVIGKSKTGNRNRWGMVEWQKPVFPLIKDGIFKDNVEQYWKDKPVRFGKEYYNNCVGCFHRNPTFLKKMFESEHKNKMEWFKNTEKKKMEWVRKQSIKNNKSSKRKQGGWKTDENITYEQIENWRLQYELSFDDFNDCDSGYCGL